MPRTSTVGRGVACERAQWLRGDPESRKTFGEEERQQSGFRRFAKRNTVKAEFAATKQARLGTAVKNFKAYAAEIFGNRKRTVSPLGDG